MSENTDKFGAHEVATWLRRHPTFLKQFPDLAVSLLVPRDDGPTASLATYQLEVLRDKNRELSRRLHELGSNAQENERLAVRTHQLTLALMRQTSAADTLKAMAVRPITRRPRTWPRWRIASCGSGWPTERSLPVALR